MTTVAPERRLVGTPSGAARVITYAARRAGAAVARPAGAPATVLLGHGAGGGIEAPDLVAIAAGLPAYGVDVVLVEQPWRVAGRRLAPAPARLDEAFVAVVEQLAPAHPFAVGGRSAGARVACRTALALGADAVVALAFPLQPPASPERRVRTRASTRAPELVGAGVSTLVVQGTRDAFGGADALAAAVRDIGAIHVLAVPGADHGFAVRVRDGGAPVQAAALADAVHRIARWLQESVLGWPVGNS